MFLNFAGGAGPSDNLNEEISRLLDRPAQLPSPMDFANAFEPTPEPSDLNGAPRELVIGGKTTRNIYDMAVDDRLRGELRVIHVTQDVVKPISVSHAVGSNSWDVLSIIYDRMSDGNPDPFNIKMAVLEARDGALIIIASSTQDEAILHACIDALVGLGLGVRKVDETTIYFYTSFTAMQKTYSWQVDTADVDEVQDLIKAMHLMLAMQSYKDDLATGSFDGCIGDAVISLPPRLDNIGTLGVFDVLLKKVIESANKVDEPARSAILKGISSVQGVYAT